MSNDIVDELRKIPYFSEIADTSLAKLAASAVKQTYPKNTLIITEGDDAGPLYIILSGKVEVYLSNEAGQKITLSIQENGSFFGELSLLDEAPRSASVMTLVPTTCYVVARNAFRQWLENHSDATFGIIRSLTQRIRILTDSVRGLALSDVYGRLTKVLYDMAIKKDGELLIDAPPSQQDLANRIVCSREMISKIMKDLTRGGYLSVDRKAIRIMRKLPAAW
jgi:CRP/FNR family cyclic AMP-dependent transcriptional regulator